MTRFRIVCTQCELGHAARASAARAGRWRLAERSLLSAYPAAPLTLLVDVALLVTALALLTDRGRNLMRDVVREAAHAALIFAFRVLVPLEERPLPPDRPFRSV